MDAKPEIVNNRVMVPIYWISKAFDVNISWNQSTYSVTFNYYGDTGSNDDEILLYRNYDFTYYYLDGTKYYFTETTSPGWLIGQLSHQQLE